MNSGKKKGLGRGLSALFGDEAPKKTILEKSESNKVSISDLINIYNMNVMSN